MGIMKTVVFSKYDNKGVSIVSHRWMEQRESDNFSEKHIVQFQIMNKIK